MVLLWCDHSTHFHLFSAWVLLGFLPVIHWKLSPRLSIIWFEHVVCVWVTHLCPTPGNGNTLQYSCLENPMDGGSWLATVRGVTKSRTWLSDFTSLHCVTPRTGVHQAPLSMGFSRHEYWSGLLFPSPGDLPDPGIKPGSPALQANLNIKSRGLLWIISPSWAGGHNRYSFESFYPSSLTIVFWSLDHLFSASLFFFFLPILQY